MPARGLAVAIVAGAALGAIAVAVMPRPVRPVALLVRAQQALAAGDAGVARRLADRAVDADYRLAIGQALIARAALAQDDVIGAEAALHRAADGGVDPARLHHLRAELLVLEGDADDARAEAVQAVPPFRVYAARIAARAQALGGDPRGAQAALRALAEAHPGDGPAWLDLARLSFGMGEPAAAEPAVQRALALMPTDPGALTLAGRLARRRDGALAALPWFDRALRADPTYLPALTEAAATFGDAGRYRAMLSATRAALAVLPDAAEPLYLQAVLAARAGMPALARRLVERTGGALDATPGMMLLAGGIAYADGRYQEAASRWGALVVAQPDSLTARRLLAAALLAAGDPAGAVDALRPLVARPDAGGDTLALAARAAAASGDTAAATMLRARAEAAGGAGVASPGTIAAYAAGSGDTPDDPDGAAAAIHALIAAGDMPGAVSRARALAAAQPGAPAAQLALGDALLAAGDAAAAEQAYRAAADRVFDEPTMLRLADALGRLGRPQAVVAMVDRYRAANPASVAALRLAGHWRLVAGDAAGALPLLRRLAGRDRSDTPLRIELARAFAANGDARDARREAVAAQALAPRNRALLLDVAAILRQTGDRDGATRLDQVARRLPGAD